MPPESESPMTIAVNSVSRYFYKNNARITALSDISFGVSSGEIVGLLGPSGCGKSTLLNIVTGLDHADQGWVEHLGRRIDGPAIGVGYMTQTDTLLPWRTIRQNIQLPLDIRNQSGKAADRLSPSEVVERVQWALDLVRLTGFADHLPSEVSGGMSKRASLARMLVYARETLLLDEPFSALDAQTRTEMHEELLNICRREQRTVVLVTHDVEEAITLCDRIIILSARPGRVRAQVEVDIPRPRDPVTVRFQPRFQDLFASVWDEIHPGAPSREERRGEVELTGRVAP
ncbi:NitT/TauT family transport system ATP-binding protein OS=Castellaniella defragrans OX=75697 GN=HNR28_000909 PE=4 SV=1 [Castellaniella defragrans]